jgi:hypothetical protein
MLLLNMTTSNKVLHLLKHKLVDLLLAIVGRIPATPTCVSMFISYQTILSLTVVTGQAVTDRNVYPLFSVEL